MEQNLEWEFGDDIDCFISTESFNLLNLRGVDTNGTEICKAIICEMDSDLIFDENSLMDADDESTTIYDTIQAARYAYRNNIFRVTEDLVVAILWCEISPEYRHKGYFTNFVEYVSSTFSKSILIRFAPTMPESLLSIPDNVDELNERFQKNYDSLEAHGWTIIPSDVTSFANNEFAAIFTDCPASCKEKSTGKFPSMSGHKLFLPSPEMFEKYSDKLTDKDYAWWLDADSIFTRFVYDEDYGIDAIPVFIFDPQYIPEQLNKNNSFELGEDYIIVLDREIGLCTWGVAEDVSFDGHDIFSLDEFLDYMDSTLIHELFSDETIKKIKIYEEQE